MMIHNDAAAALLHAQKKLFSFRYQHTVYFIDAKIHDSGHNVPFPVIQTCLEVICVHIFLEHTFIYLFCTQYLAGLSLYVQEQEIESLAAIESELENVAQKLHDLRRG